MTVKRMSWLAVVQRSTTVVWRGSLFGLWTVLRSDEPHFKPLRLSLAQLWNQGLFVPTNPAHTRLGFVPTRLQPSKAAYQKVQVWVHWISWKLCWGQVRAGQTVWGLYVGQMVTSCVPQSLLVLLKNVLKWVIGARAVLLFCGEWVRL